MGVWILLGSIRPITLHGQVARTDSGWRITVADASNAAIPKASIYVRDISAASQGEPVKSVGESDANGQFALPPSTQARDLIIFATGFSPAVTFLDGQETGHHAKSVHMQVLPCNYPDVICDTFDTKLARKLKRKHR